MNKQELIKKYEGAFEKLYAFPVVTINAVLEDLRQLEEPQKVVVPQFVADHLKNSKEVGRDLQDAMNSSTILEEVDLWLYTDNNMDVFARAWLDGHEIEKEKRYLVKMKGIEGHNSYLKYNKNLQHWYFGSLFIYVNDVDTRTYHTRKELEESGFGEAFNSPLFEVEEVE